MIRILQQNTRIVKALFALIIGAAVITMVITLVPGIFDDSGTQSGDVYATVRTPGLLGHLDATPTAIKNEEVDKMAHQMLQQQGYPDMLLPYIMPRAGNLLVQRAILGREAQRLGLGATDADVRDFLQHGPYASIFFPNGVFIGEDAYMNLIQNQAQESIADFESAVKQDISITRLEELITGGATVSDNEVRASYKLQGTKVKFDYAVISADDVRKSINPSDAELQAFFKQNAPRYAGAAPETRKISYVAFDASKIPGGKPQVSDADIQQFYQQHLAEYAVKEQVKARHILISAPKGTDAAADAAAKAKAADILKQLKGGANFAELAKKNSDDPGSKDQGGDLGWVTQETQFVPEFKKAVFALNPGQTSDLVKTEFGYHIIQVTEKQNAHTKSLAEVKDSIASTLSSQRVAAAEQAFADQLAAQAKAQGLDKAAAAHGLKVVTTDYLASNGIVAGLSDGSGLLTQAFTAKKGDAPATVSTGDGFAVYKVDDVKPAHVPDFAEYKSHIEDDYRAQKAPELMNQKLNALAARAKVLADLKNAAKELNVEVKTSDLVGRDGQVPDLGSMTGPASVAFTLAPGQISKPINNQRNGAILSVVEKQEPTADDIAKNFDATRTQLLQKRQNELFGIYVDTLSKQYETAGAVHLSKQAKAPASPFGK